MNKIIALTAFVLFASAPAVQSAPAVTQDLRATDFSSVKEVDPAPQGKLKGVKSRKSKGGPSSGVEAISVKEVDPAPQGKLRKKKSLGGGGEVSIKEVDPAPQGKGGISSGAEKVGFNPQPDPPGIDKKKISKKTLGVQPPPEGDKVSGPSPHMNSPRLDTPRFSVPSLGGAGGARVR